ncbi:hypothetical protein NGF19_05645 [Streptomyces sp. RY43-2]|uniref:Uncharacterized protein n=1 Tax=Streptomyces macrolidinus TaxID=2952607 RepID=A0ABT0Z934_9ACTN|nr:hypothetical protein [Streptomyces macrolidinus]MCN9240280.1 hypothetical protein [Streptomyces macrolidinus]
MATPHPLKALALDHAGLARWALGRMAAAAAENVRFSADAECCQHRVPEDLSGRYGWHSVGHLGEAEAASSARVRFDTDSSARLRRDDEAAGDPLLSLCDPARLVSGVAAASAGQCAWNEGRPCVDVTLVPHPWTADPQDPWLPPGVKHLTAGVDIATGFLLHTGAYDAQGCFRSGHLRNLRTTADGSAPKADEAWTPAGTEEGASFVLARMATSLLDPVRMRADVVAVPEIESEPSVASVPSRRSWAVTLRGRNTITVNMSGDYEPDQADPAVARLAELLSPARIVSHLAEVAATGPTSIKATVRPMRSFPFSAWAPEEGLTCHFTVDPTTGILLQAHTMDGPQTLFRNQVTAYLAE